MTTRALTVLMLAAGLLVLSGCGEKTKVTIYKQGKYQGKPDNVPWQSAPFNNNQGEWEKAIKARNTAQNDDLRVGQQ